MSTHETPDTNERPARTPETDRIRSEGFYAAADYIEKVADLASALRSDRMPDTSEYNFMFDGQKLDEMYRPEIIEQMIAIYGPLDELAINIGYHEGEPSSSISFNYYFKEPTASDAVLLVIERPGYYDKVMPDTDTIYEDVKDEHGKIHTIGTMSPADLSRTVASLMYPSQTGDWSQFDQLNLNDGTIYEALVDALQKHATDFSGNESFDLSPLDQSRAGLLAYTIDNGELIHAELLQVLDSDVMFVGQGTPTPVSVKHSLSVEVGLMDGLSVEVSDVYENGDNMLSRSKVQNVEPFHFKAATEFALHHTKRANPVETERMVELNLPPYEPFKDEA